LIEARDAGNAPEKGRLETPRVTDKGMDWSGKKEDLPLPSRLHAGIARRLICMRARALSRDTKGIKLLLIRGDVTRIRGRAPRDINRPSSALTENRKM